MNPVLLTADKLSLAQNMVVKQIL